LVIGELFPFCYGCFFQLLPGGPGKKRDLRNGYAISGDSFPGSLDATIQR
jgi:hypothetical protein